MNAGDAVARRRNCRDNRREKFKKLLDIVDISDSRLLGVLHISISRVNLGHLGPISGPGFRDPDRAVITSGLLNSR
jgi:hypothetical protein